MTSSKSALKPNIAETSKKILVFSLENPRNSLVLQASFGRSVYIMTAAVKRWATYEPHQLIYIEDSDTNPSNAEAITFIQSARTQRFLKTIQNLSCWYSLESSS